MRIGTTYSNPQARRRPEKPSSPALCLYSTVKLGSPALSVTVRTVQVSMLNDKAF